MRRSITVVAVLLLALVGTAPSQAQSRRSSEAPGQKNADGLLKAADRAVGYVVKSGWESKDAALAQSNEDAEPFWQAVKKLSEAVDKSSRGLFLKDHTFFTSLANATSALEEVRVTYVMSGAKDEAVQEGIEKIDASRSLLREHYSKESARLDEGGDLTADEKGKLDEIKNKQRSSRDSSRSSKEKSARTRRFSTACVDRVLRTSVPELDERDR